MCPDFLSEKKNGIRRSLIWWSELSIWTDFMAVSFHWSLRVCRLEHPGTSPRSEKRTDSLVKDEKFTCSSCHGFVAQWLERPTGKQKTLDRSLVGHCCVFFFSPDPDFSSKSYLCRRRKGIRRSLIWWNGPNRSELSIWTTTKEKCSGPTAAKPTNETWSVRYFLLGSSSRGELNSPTAWGDGVAFNGVNTTSRSYLNVQS